MLMVTW